MLGDVEFIDALRPLVDDALTHFDLSSTQQFITRDLLAQNFLVDIRTYLTCLAGPTLILELHIARLSGSLGSGSSEGRFQNFISLAQSNLVSLLRKYPILERHASCFLVGRIRCWKRMLNRLRADQRSLRVCLFGGNDPGRLLSIRTIGDVHSNGAAALSLEFETGAKLAYKPRSLVQERSYHGILQIANSLGFEWKFFTSALLDCGNYGWMKWNDYEPCTSSSDFSQFYAVVGGHLALLYLLGAVDMHFENVVATKNQMHFVDLETLMHPTIRSRPGYDDVLDSVGILPSNIRNPDLSALGAIPGKRLKSPTTSIAHSGTDKVRLVRKVDFLPSGQHRPFVARPPNCFRHVVLEALTAGFQGMYKVLKRRREFLMSSGPFKELSESKCRVILRNTEAYQAIIGQTFHPMTQANPGKWRNMIASLGELSGLHKGKQLRELELAALRKCFVPRFTAFPKQTGIWLDEKHVSRVSVESGISRYAAGSNRFLVQMN